MEIECIFAEILYAFRYEDEPENEFDRLMDLWTDVNFLSSFAEENGVDKYVFVEDILANANEIQDFISELSQTGKFYGYFFHPLQISEEKRVSLSLQKGKIRDNQLRLYAIRIDDNCFVITGGAIKMSLKMNDHKDTRNELVKLQIAKEFLKENGVFDNDSFFELLNE